MPGRCQTQHCRREAATARPQTCKEATEQRSLHKNKRAITKGQGKEAETRKISVTARTVKDFTGSPREDGENPSQEAFKKCVGQTSAGKV